MSTNFEVWKRIETEKTKMGLKDNELEIQLGLKPKTINNWKRGLSSSYMSMLPNLANYFNVSIDYLLGLTDEQQKKSPTDTKSMSDNDFIKFLNDNGYSVENLVAKLAKLNDKQIKLLIEFINELSKNK